MNVISKYSDRTWFGIITALSLVVVAVVALLLFRSQPAAVSGIVNPGIYILPKLNAFLNGSVSLLLISGFLFIRAKNIRAHRACMIAAFTFSIIFLVSYISYHYNATHTYFGDINHDGIATEAEKLSTGSLRYIYVLVLLTHIVLAAAIVPMTLLTLYRIWRGDVAKHRKIARWTFPIWLYVSITGVVVYLLISPYYPV